MGGNLLHWPTQILFQRSQQNFEPCGWKTTKNYSVVIFPSIGSAHIKKMENPNTKQMQKMKHLWTSLGKRMPFIPLFYVTTLSLSPLLSLPTLQLHAPFSVLLKWLKLLDAVPWRLGLLLWALLFVASENISNNFSFIQLENILEGNLNNAQATSKAFEQ